MKEVVEILFYYIKNTLQSKWHIIQEEYYHPLNLDMKNAEKV